MARPRLFDTNDKPGRIKEHSGPNLPSNHLWCNGALVNVSDYPELYAEIGTTYNTGGETAGVTFRVPNRAGRSGVGAGTYTDPTAGSVTRTLGQTGGEATHVLAVAEMPSHIHNVSAPLVFGAVTGQIGWSDATYDGSVTELFPSASQGGDGPHNNMHPYIVQNYIVRF